METLLESHSKFIWKGCGIASDAWWQWLCRLKNVLLPFAGKRQLLKVWGVLENQRILSPSLRGNKNNWLTKKDKLDCIGKYIQVFFKKILLDNWSSSGIAVFSMQMSFLPFFWRNWMQMRGNFTEPALLSLIYYISLIRTCSHSAEDFRVSLLREEKRKT